MPSVILATFWRGFPFWVISFLAALQNVPLELYETAALDGANAWQRFRHITLPEHPPCRAGGGAALDDLDDEWL